MTTPSRIGDGLAGDLQPLQIERHGEQRAFVHIDHVPAGQIAGIEATALHRLALSGSHRVHDDVLRPRSCPCACWTVNNTALPPGSTWGQRCVTSPACLSSVVSGWGVPPAEETLDKADLVSV